MIMLPRGIVSAGVLLLGLTVTVDIRAAPQFWANQYGAGMAGRGDVVVTDDGYVVAGTIRVSDGRSQLWVVKTGAGGDIIWSRGYGSPRNVFGATVDSTADGGVIVASGTATDDAGGSDAWVLRLDRAGNVLWQKSFGSLSAESSGRIRSARDGGAALVVNSQLRPGASGVWIVKLNQAGGIEWQHTYDRPGDEQAWDAVEAEDGGLVVAGTLEVPYSSEDFWVLRLDREGAVLWQKSYGGPGRETAVSVAATPDSGFVVAGWVESERMATRFREDVWILKLDAGGSIVWQNAYQSSVREGADSIRVDRAGELLVSGRSGGFTAAQRVARLRLMKLGADGRILWWRVFPGSLGAPSAARPTEDGGCVLQATGLNNVPASGLWLFRLPKELSFMDAVLEKHLDRVDPRGSDGIRRIRTSVQAADTTLTVSDTNVVGVDTTAGVNEVPVFPRPY